ncbi:hypothetical protein BOO71_0002158 [Deinococcus marmoris]|uniref:Uncharacterized protein n=2 Tax=Deinococcus marmoris TaxID=249408 RepID=A0A1U7P397_9DEIO|nr:hypothetical protein BOO71_0002158 [Deinococcus marmoris]
MGETLGLYRAFDATAFAESLYARVQETVERGLLEELLCITDDDVYAAVTGVVDLPDRMARNLTRSFVQQGGRLPDKQRKQFPELTDAEIPAMTAAMAHLFSAQKTPGDAG